MQRYNIFKQAYKGLRAALHETSITLQRTDYTNSIEALAALEKMSEALTLFVKSSYIENQFILPVVKQYETVVVQTVEEERSKECILSRELKRLAEVYKLAISPAEKTEISNSIIKVFTQFTAFMLVYLGKKEEALNEVLLFHFNDKEIRQLKRLIVTKMSPAEVTLWGKWIIWGSNNTEIINWLKEIQIYVSPDVFAAIYAQAEEVLPTNRFNQVVDGISEGIWIVNGEW